MEREDDIFLKYMMSSSLPSEYFEIPASSFWITILCPIRWYFFPLTTETVHHMQMMTRPRSERVNICICWKATVFNGKKWILILKCINNNIYIHSINKFYVREDTFLINFYR